MKDRWRQLGFGFATIGADNPGSANSAPSSLKQKPFGPNEDAYAEAVEVSGVSRFLFISGQVPLDDEDQTPADFKSQCRLAWARVEKQLEAAGMNLENLVKVTTYLADRKYRDENREIRSEILGDHWPALTVIIAEIYDPEWLLEIEAIAAA